MIEKDQEEVAAQLRRVLADVEAKKEQLRTRATEGDSEKPLVLICKPSGLSDLMNSLIQQLEYHNFSASMRFRVEQDRMMKTILRVSMSPKMPQSLPLVTCRWWTSKSMRPEYLQVHLKSVLCL